MRRVIWATLIVASSLFANVYNLQPIHITKDVTCIIGDYNPPMKSNKGFVSNMCYVDIGDSLVVLDTGPTYIFAQEFHAIMKKEHPDKKVSNVVLSNYHDDRVQGASYFQELGAKIIGYKNINKDIKSNPDKFERMKMMFGKDILKNTKVIDADTLVDNGYKIKGSKKTLEVLKLSKISEEKSDIVIYSKDDDFLFVGNIIFNGRMLNYTTNSNIDGWIEALEKIQQIGAKYILGGHGNRYDKDSYKPSLEYLRVLRKDVKSAFEKEIEVEDIKIGDCSFKTIKHYKQLNHNNISNYYNQLEWAE